MKSLEKDDVQSVLYNQRNIEGETQRDASTTQSTRRITDQKKTLGDGLELLHTYSMIVPKCVGGVTNPMKNHGSMILPLLI